MTKTKGAGWWWTLGRKAAMKETVQQTRPLKSANREEGRGGKKVINVTVVSYLCHINFNVTNTVQPKLDTLSVSKFIFLKTVTFTVRHLNKNN